MVKLDISILKYLSKEDMRILVAIEMGMKNHGEENFLFEKTK